MSNDPYKPPTSPVGEDGVNNSSQGKGIKFFKKVFIGIGVFFTLIILLFFIVSISTPSYKEVDDEALILIDKIVPNINTWEFHEFKPYLDDILLEQVPEEDLIKFLTSYKKLGDYKSHEKGIRQNCMSGISEDSFSRCNYVSMAKFSKGDAQILIGIILKNDKAKLIQIKINSDAFL